MPVQPELEQQLQRLCESQAWPEATTAAIEGYGAEVLGYLTARVGDRYDASDVFSLWCENIWRGLPKFRWEATFRTWAYRLAHNTCSRYQQGQHADRHLPLSEAPEVLALAQRVRTATARHLQSEAKGAVAKLRDALQEADRSLLILRIDRGLSWAEIADVHGDGPERAPTYRKRFARAKERLRVLAEGAGLL